MASLVAQQVDAGPVPVEPPAYAPRFSDRYLSTVLGTGAALVFGLAARRRLQAPPSGDEPHYLVLNEAMRRYHTIDPTPVYANRDYWSFYPAYLDPQTTRLPDGTTIPLHNIGGPLLWHPFYLLYGRAGVLAFLVAVTVVTVLNLYWLLRQLGVVRAYAATVSALFVVGSPLYVYASMSYIEMIGALVVLFAARQILASHRSPVRWAVAGAGLGYLPFVHGRFLLFTLVGGALIAARVYADTRSFRLRPYLPALGPLVVVFGAVVAFTLVAYGTVNPGAGNASAGARLLAVSPLVGVPSLLFDRRYGLLPYFPVLFFAVPGCLLSLRRGLTWVHVTLLGFALPYLLAISTFNLWWGGYSPPARFLSVVAPLLGYYVAICLQRLHSAVATAAAVVLAGYAFLVSLSGDILLAERFDSGSRDPQQLLLIDRASQLFTGMRISRTLPSVLLHTHLGNAPKFLAWTAAGAGFTVIVWLFGRRRPADRVPVLVLAPLTSRWPWRNHQQPR